MNISMTFKNFEPSEHLKKYAERRFEKLRRFIPKSENVEMTVVLTVDKFRHKADVQFVGDNINVSAVEQSSDMYATVDMVRDKLETQLKKHMARIKEKRRSGTKDFSEPFAAETAEEAHDERRLVTAEIVEPKPLYVEEAILQFEQRPEDVVLVFTNADESKINILYRKKNGDMGLIDPEM